MFSNYNFYDFYNYIKKIIPFFHKENFIANPYIFNHHLYQATKYNVNLNIETGYKLTRQFLYNKDIESSCYEFNLNDYGRDDIDPLKFSMKKELFNSIRLAFNVLPNKLKKIMILHVLENTNFYDIAKKFNEGISNIVEAYFFAQALLKFYFINYYYHITIA